jgi:short-subunit dehydrogenase
MNLTTQTKYTAIVTGSTRGIGKETALLLLKNGINVILYLPEIKII